MTQPRRLVVEADGGSRGNPGPAGYGALVRDAATGTVLAEIAEHIGLATNNVAEYRGLIAGLEAARALDPDAEVEARLDSKLVVEQLSGRWKIKHPDLQPLALRAQRVLPPGRVRYTWVPREQNRHADRLANQALDAAAAGRPWTRAAAPEPGPPVPAPILLPEGSELPTPARMLLVRHGTTDATTAGVFSGSPGTDPGLSAEGRREVERLAERAAAGELEPVVAVVSSPAVRAQETAAALARSGGLDVAIDERLRECAFGDWEGATFGEVQQRWPHELAAWLGSPAAAPPGGESLDEVTRRVEEARVDLIDRYPGHTVLVVSHVTPIKTLVRLALGAPAASLFRMEVRPTGVTALDWYPDGNASLRYLNDTSHLR